MASIRDMRMLNLGNGCGGHYFVRGLLLKLQQDSMESREAVKELEEKYPMEEKTFRKSVISGKIVVLFAILAAHQVARVKVKGAVKETVGIETFL